MTDYRVIFEARDPNGANCVLNVQAAHHGDINVSEIAAKHCDPEQYYLDVWRIRQPSDYVAGLETTVRYRDARGFEGTL